MSEDKFMFEIKDIGSGTESQLTLDICMRLDCGLDGGWEVKWSKVQEVGRIVKPKEKSLKNIIKPTAPFKPKPKLHTSTPSPYQSGGPNQNKPLFLFHLARPKTQGSLCLWSR